MYFINHILIVLTILSLSSCTKNRNINPDNRFNPKNTLSQYHLKGKIKFLKETEYNVFKKDNEIQKGNFIKTKGNYRFNINGFINESDFTQYDYYSGISYIKKVKYNEYGFEIERNLNNPPIMKSNFLYHYKFNEKERILEQICYDPDIILCKIFHKYDKKVNLIDKEYYNNQNKLSFIDNFLYKYRYLYQLSIFNKYSLSFRDIYRYDENGNQILNVCINNNGKIESVNFYKYDKWNNIVEDKLTGKEGKLIYKNIFKYNNNGDLIEKFDPRPMVLNPSPTKYNYKYLVYDNAGNWIKAIDYENGVPVTITEREIEYY